MLCSLSGQLFVGVSMLHFEGSFIQVHRKPRRIAESSDEETEAPPSPDPITSSPVPAATKTRRAARIISNEDESDYGKETGIRV